MPSTNASLAQWLFPPSALRVTPTVASGFATMERELYDRSRGVEFLYRLGSSLGLPSHALFTAATWFHRFYMRFSMEDYHRQDVGAACIFLATKTEECGRKLRDVARVCYGKANAGVDISKLPNDHPEVERTQTIILQTEEALLEALCFDFVVDSPHALLVDFFAANEFPMAQEKAWTLAHDSFRTPLCILFPPRIIAASCYVLAQHLADGPHSPSLDARIAFVPPAATLPTPPTHKPSSPDASRVGVDYFNLTEMDLKDVADALCILLAFYRAHDVTHKHLEPLRHVTPPSVSSSRDVLYSIPFSQVAAAPPETAPRAVVEHTRTPASNHGGVSPATEVKSESKGGWKPVNSVVQAPKAESKRLDLS